MGGRGAFKSNNFTYLNPDDTLFETTNLFYGKKVIKAKGKTSAGLPEYSGKSDVYIAVNKNNKYTQMRIYKNHAPVIDIDFGHENHYKLNKGNIHVHDFVKDGDYMIRKNNGRQISDNELKEYGDIIRKIQEHNK